MLKGKGYFKWVGKGKKPPWKRDFQRLICETWTYCDSYLNRSGEPPYWNTEMSMVGNMAIALGRMQGGKNKYIAALEYIGERTDQRQDLWIDFGGKAKDILVETKLGWVSYNRKDSRTAADNIAKIIGKARRQLSGYAAGNSEKAKANIALVFAPLYFTCDKKPKKRSKRKCRECGFPQNNDDELVKWMSEVESLLPRKGLKISCWGYYLPHMPRPGLCLQWDNDCHPAVMIFGTVLKNNQKRR